MLSITNTTKDTAEKTDPIARMSRTSLVTSLIGLVILFVLAAGLISIFVTDSNRQIVEQNQQYLHDASQQSLRNLDDLFSSSQESIILISRLCSQSLAENGDVRDSAAPYVDFIRDMQDTTAFNFVRYADRDGIVYAADGKTIDGRQREYYIEGMKGVTGACYIAHSMFDADHLIAFYTPVYSSGGEIAGVIYGSINTERLSERMKNEFFGVDANEYICLRDGTICYGPTDKRIDENICDYLESEQFLPEDKISSFKQAFENGDSIECSYESPEGTGNVFVSPMGDPDFMVVTTFPPEAGKNLMKSASNGAMTLAWAIALLFALYAVVVMLLHIRNNRALAKKNADVTQIVDSVKQMFSKFLVLDLAEDTYEYLENSTSDVLGMDKKGKLDKWFDKVRGLYAEEEDSEAMSRIVSRKGLSEMFSGDTWLYQYEYKVKNVERWEKMSLIRVDKSEDGGPRRILVAVEDVTELRKAEIRQKETLEAAYHSAKFANQAKSDFLSRMSHDIRTPMNVIMGIASLMETYSDDPVRVRDGLAKINSSSAHLLGIINEVLDMSRIESGKFALNEAPFRISSLVEDVRSILEPQASAKGHSLIFDIQGIEHDCVSGDAQKLQQVFVNIISNAVKYTPDGGHIDVALRESNVMDNGTVEYDFVFSDDGIGMDEEFLERIFVPFERVEDVRTSKIQGTGLGMTIIYNIIQLMGGHIQVESEPGKGSTFTVHVGFKTVSEEEMKAQLNLEEAAETTSQENRDGDGDSGNRTQSDENASMTQKDDKKRFAGIRALVVDDNELNLEIFTAILDMMEIESETAGNGREALDKFASKPVGYYDVIFMDIQMPVMDGYEAMSAIRSMAEDENVRRMDAANIPIIAVTANTFAEEVKKAKDCGANEHVPKPVSVKALLEVMDIWVGKR